MTNDIIKLNLRTVPEGRPTYGEPAALVVPVLEQQKAWEPMIKPGSAIVAFMNPQNKYTLYFEGNLFDASNMRTFRERALHAYGRMTESYPTIAKCIGEPSMFETIGEFTPKNMDIEDSPALKAWLAQDSTLQEETPGGYPRHGGG